MLAHDLRGALNGVIGGTIELGRLEIGADARRQIDRIAAAATVLDAMVGVMIGDHARDPAGAVDLQEMIEFLRARWAGEAQAKDARFEIACAPDVPRRLRVDRLRLIRVLGNLIGNAITHSHDAQSAHVVHVAIACGPGGDLEFCVVDDGPGLDTVALADNLSRGMVRSGTVDAQLHGLGLHIVKGLTEEMGGVLELRTPEGGGLAVLIRFPAALFDMPSAPEGRGRAGMAALGRRRRGAGRDLTGLRVLLAEDNPTNQLVASQMLRALGAEVTIASDGIEALEVYERRAFDLLVVDIEMPRLSGLDVIRTIRRGQDARARVPIVALTAYSMREHRTRISKAGATGLISKPITSIDAFGTELRRFLDAAPDEADAPGADEAEPGGPVINAESYAKLRRTMGPETMGELLDMVINDLGSVRGTLAQAEAQRDCPAIRAASHILVAVAGAIGATRLQTCAQTLNRAAHDGIEDELLRGLTTCFREIDAATAFATNERAKV